MSQVRSCLYEKADSEVKTAYSDLLTNLRKKHPSSLNALRKSQSSWELFASDSCDFQAEFNPDNMLTEDARYNCWVSFSRARIKVLKSWQSQAK